MNPRRLRRTDRPRWAAPPARVVHLGLGAFFRAHQAVYTAHAADADRWGITAFTGRSHDLPDRLATQDGLYTLTVRGPDADRVEVIPSVVGTHPGADTAAWKSALSSPVVTALTLTVTEAAYRPGAGSIARRLIGGLDARRRADAGPITIVPCDNVADNATVLRTLLLETAARTDPHLVEWMARSVSVVGTVVDRITPAATAADVDAAAVHGWVDAAPVVTEPFSEWVLAPTGPVGPLPDWASAGAVFVDDPGPYARRKLHLLNGAHSLLAHAGLLRGHTTVAEAIDDPELRGFVEAWWDGAGEFVGGSPADRRAYRAGLIERFANPRMGHRLAQIAVDGSVKMAVRIVPVAAAELAAGRDARSAATIVGAWVAFVRRAGSELVDARRDEVLEALAGGGSDAVRRAVALVDPRLADDRDFAGAVLEAVAFFERSP